MDHMALLNDLRLATVFANDDSAWVRMTDDDAPEKVLLVSRAAIQTIHSYKDVEGVFVIFGDADVACVGGTLVTE